MPELYTHNFTAMASPCCFQLYEDNPRAADQACQAAEAEVRRIEQKYSRYRDDSIVSRINAAAGKSPIEVDEETAALLDYAAAAWQQSDGLFDISSGVLRRVWDFRSGKLPVKSAVDAALKLVGWDKVTWADGTVSLNLAGMEIDFGGFGKEYAVDSAARVLQEQGMHSALVDLGGDIRVLGPQPDDQPWRVGIRNPLQPEQALMVVPLKYGAVASSGDYERCMVIDDKRYSHLLDPRNGWPVSDGFRAVSVVGDLCLLAGTVATVAMLQTATEGERWLAESELPSLWISDNDTGGRLLDMAEQLKIQELE